MKMVGGQSIVAANRLVSRGWSLPIDWLVVVAGRGGSIDWLGSVWSTHQLVGFNMVDPGWSFVWCIWFIATVQVIGLECSFSAY